MADVDDAINDGVKEMQGISRKLFDRIQELAHELDTAPGSSKLESTKQALANADRVRNQIVAELKRTGQRDMLTVIEKQAVVAARRHIKDQKLGEFEPDYKKVVRDTLAGIKPRLAEPWDIAANAIRKAMREALTGGLSITVLLADISSALDVSARSAQTVVDTAINGVASNALLDVVESNPDIAATARFEFIGARADGVIRKFCRKYLGTIKTLEEIRALQREQGTDLDVFAYGGGYNCRHRWVLVVD